MRAQILELGQDVAVLVVGKTGAELAHGSGVDEV